MTDRPKMTYSENELALTTASPQPQTDIGH